MPVNFAATPLALYPNNGLSFTTVNNLSALTMSIWMRPTSLNSSTALALMASTQASTSSARVFLGILAGSGIIQAGGRRQDADTSTNVGTQVATLGTWYHVVGVINFLGDAVSVYINGVLNASAGMAGAAGNCTATNSARGGIGGTGIAGNSFIGDLADARFYQRALSANEIETLYALKGKDNIFLNLHNRWRLEGRHLVSSVGEPDIGNARTAGCSASGTPLYNHLATYPLSFTPRRIRTN